MIVCSPAPAVAEGCCEQRNCPLVHPSLVHSAQLLGLQPCLLGDILQEAQGHQEAGILLILPVARVLTCKGWQEMIKTKNLATSGACQRVPLARVMVQSGKIMLQVLPAGHTRGAPTMLHLAHKGAAYWWVAGVLEHVPSVKLAARLHEY